jgi:hypothetical protein
MNCLRQWSARLVSRFPILQKLFGIGWKVLLTETLIEIPFLILESSILMRFLFGFTLGLTLWQYLVVACGLYLLIEGVRWVFACYFRKSNNYKFFKQERELLQLILTGIAHLRRKRDV